MPHPTDWRELQAYQRLKGQPFSQFNRVVVTFPTANVDVVVPHTLRPPTPEEVEYHVVRTDRACRVYDNQAAGRKPWGIDYIVLRCDTAGAIVTLLLTVEQEEL